MAQCQVCGMVYSKGQAEDEKLHRQQHAVLQQGLQLQVRKRASACMSAGRMPAPRRRTGRPCQLGCTAGLQRWLLTRRCGRRAQGYSRSEVLLQDSARGEVVHVSSGGSGQAAVKRVSRGAGGAAAGRGRPSARPG
jgi:hypothetical protein